MDGDGPTRPFTYILLWDIRHWLTPLAQPPNVCACVICGLKRLGVRQIITNAVEIARLAYHQYRISRGLEDCPCSRPHRDGRTYCLLSEGYAVPRDIGPESFKLCNICSNLATSTPNTEAITSEDGLVVAFSKRHLERAAFHGCPLCRIILDRLIAKHDAFIRPLWRLPFCGKILLGFRAVAGPAQLFSNTDRRHFNTMEVSLLSPVGHPRWWSREEVAYEPERLLLFAVAAEKDNPAAEQIPSRPPHPDVASDQSMHQAVEWIRECSAHHDTCLPRPAESLLPTRLVDISALNHSGQIKLCLSKGQKGKYVALSYCWGQKSQPVMTLQSNIERFLDESLPADDLPQTVLDAIHVTQRLGMQYLWVDVLCIVQDSKEDKNQEIGRLQDYFADAYVTIIAANAASCQSGFLRPRDWYRAKFDSIMKPDRAPPAFNMPWVCRNGHMGSLLFQPWNEYDFMKEAVNSRAWTLEERLLSPRMLAYTSTQLFWMCQTGIKTMEVNTSGFREQGFGRLPDHVFTAGKDSRAIQEPTEECLSDMLRVWRTIVEDYTARTLTDPADKLRAIAGIAARMKTTAPELMYLAGTWHSKRNSGREIAAELMWRVPEGNKTEIQNEDQTLRHLSFSWSSVQGPVTWDMAHKFNGFVCPVPSVEVLDARLELLKPHFHFGFLKEAVLILRGPTKDCKAQRGPGGTFFVPYMAGFVGDLDTFIPDEWQEGASPWDGRVSRRTVPRRMDDVLWEMRGIVESELSNCLTRLEEGLEKNRESRV